jgi:3-methylfumaryl-CoA hydratase
MPGDAAPLGLHWCLAPATVPMADIGPDGHPARGGFLPPVPLPRRMRACGRLTFHGDLGVGDRVERACFGRVESEAAVMCPFPPATAFWFTV